MITPRFSALALSLALPLVAGACTVATAPAPTPTPPTVVWPQGTPVARRITITNDVAALSARLHINPTAVGLRAVGLKTQAVSLSLGAPPPAPITLHSVGQLDPPQAVAEIVNNSGNGHETSSGPIPLYAVTVSIAANVALVSYMLTGTYFAGAVDVLDITNVEAPVLRASALFDHMNIATAEFVPDDPTSGSGDVYLVAGTCDASYPATALMERLRLDNFQMSAAADYRLPLLGGSGEGLAIAGGRLYGTAGVQGGVRMFDQATQALLGEQAVGGDGDARWVSVAGGMAVVVSGGLAGRLDVFDDQSLRPLGSFPFDGATVPESKSTVQLVGARAFVAAGPGGMQVLSTRTGHLLGQIPVPADPNYGPADLVNNAVSIDRDLVVMSMGGPGVYVAGSAAPLDTPDSEAPFSAAWLTGLDIPGSVNHVSFRGHALLVASGASGLQILSID